MNREARVFVPWLAIGWTMWQFINSTVTEASTTFSRVSGIIHNISMPLSIHVYCAVMRHVINYFHNFIIVILVLVIFPPQITASMAPFYSGVPDYRDQRGGSFDYIGYFWVLALLI